MTGYRGGYRRDCSGFVSYAWDLPENLVTWRLPLVTKRIGKSQLRAGDILLNHRAGPGARHVVMFEKWANKRKTRYYGLEQTGQSGVDRAIRRVLPYPYRFQKSMYKPYRYVGMSRYYAKIARSQRQPVRGYRGRVETPVMAKARRAAAARRERVRERAEKAEVSREAARQRREALLLAAEAASRAASSTAVGVSQDTASEKPGPLMRRAVRASDAVATAIVRLVEPGARSAVAAPRARSRKDGR